MCEYFACMYVCHHMYAWCPWKLGEGIRSLELEFYMLQTTIWVLGIEPGPLQKQQVLLTSAIVSVHGNIEVNFIFTFREAFVLREYKV